MEASNPLPEAPARGSAGAPRKATWFFAGAALWLVVGAAAFAMYWNRPAAIRESSPLDDEAVPLVVRVPIDGGDAPSVRGASSDESTGSTGVRPTVVRPEEAGDVRGPAWDLAGIDDFDLVERSGRKVTKADLLGRPWVVCFIFTRCAGPCRDITAQMSRLQESLKEADVRLVTLTVDPDYDTPAVLRNEADAFGADADRWLFLTGRKAEIYGLIQKSFRMPVKEMTGPDRRPGWEVLHTTNLLLVDERGVVVDKYDGKDPEQVARLVERLTGPAVAEVPTVGTNGDAATRPDAPAEAAP